MSPNPPADGPTLDEVLAECAERIFAALEKEGRKSLRKGFTKNGRRLTIGLSKASARQREDRSDLPPEFAQESKATCEVFRLIREVRSAEPGETPLQPADIHRRMNPDHPRVENVTKRTIHRALSRLRDVMKLVHHTHNCGYVLGRDEQVLF